MKELGLNRILVVHGLVGLGLLPKDLLGNLSETHLRAGDDITVTHGLPPPLTAVAYGERAFPLLELLSRETRFYGSPNTLIQDCERDQADILPIDIGAGEVRIGHFAIRHEHIESGALPRYVPWVNAGDVELIERVLSLSDDWISRMVHLRALLIERLERLHRGHSPRPPGVAPLRVLYASNASAYSGAEECLVNSAQAIRALGIDTHALIACEGLLTQKLRETDTAVHCPRQDFSQPNVANTLLVDRLVRSTMPSIIHCNAPVGPPLLSAAKLQGIPILQWVRVANLTGFEEHLLCADRITAVSQFVADEVAKEMVDANKIRVVWDGVDCERFRPDRLPDRNVRAEYGIPDNALLLLCVGRFSPNKRHDVLLKAFAHSLGIDRQRWLVLVGDSPGRGTSTYENCLAGLSELGIQDRAIVAGFQTDIHSFEAAADVSILCSEREPLGTFVLESMALGKAVVVAASGGLPEMVEHGVSGLHCIVGDAESLAIQIHLLADSPEYRTALGREARKRALASFSLAAHARRLNSIYQEFAAEGCEATK